MEQRPDALARLEAAQVPWVRGFVAQHQRRGPHLIRSNEARSGGVVFVDADEEQFTRLPASL